MCGIGGIVNRNNEKVAVSHIRQMMDRVQHRGPDGSGLYNDANVAFGHRRLAIVDLSDDGHQPMTYENESFVITYNGEIYNYIELREQLKKEGVHFYTRTDTEVILAAYLVWGAACVSRFNGMWAFAIYDKEKRRLFCSRDRFGIKPFFYRATALLFQFASEIKQLLVGNSSPLVNQRILMDFLVLGLSEHTSATFFADIQTLPGGHNLFYDLRTNEFSIRKYYYLQIDRNVAKLDSHENLEMYTELLYNSVALRLRSDVKVGTCLSGGLDSSSIAVIASNRYGNSFNAITASSSDPANNEIEFAQCVVQSHNLNWNIVEPDDTAFLKKMLRVVTSQDEPVTGPSLVMQDAVFQKARNIGCKVMLDGQGGDETLLGYERYFPTLLLKGSVWQRMEVMREFVRNSQLSMSRMIEYSAYFLVPFVRRQKLLRDTAFLKRKYVNLVDWKLINTLSQKYRNIESLQEVELFSTQLPHLLRYEDRNSMINSIEARLPFLDYRLVEYSLSLPVSYKLKDGWSKYILRKALVSELPEDIVWRKNKIGFEAPTAIWFKNNEKIIMQTIKESPLLNTICPDISKVKLQNVWRYFFVSLWEKSYNMRLS